MNDVAIVEKGAIISEFNFKNYSEDDIINILNLYKNLKSIIITLDNFEKGYQLTQLISSLDLKNLTIYSNNDFLVIINNTIESLIFEGNEKEKIFNCNNLRNFIYSK